MSDITVIILTKNEEKNIEACVNSAQQIAKRIIVVDSGSTDKTVELAEKNGAETVYHEWVGHARQFNWALDNCNIDTQWVFRLDADERISKELAKEILQKLSSEESLGVNGYEMRWRMYFMGKQLKHGGNNKTYIVRLFRFGKARVEDKSMDERFVVEGKIERLNSSFIHYDYKTLDDWLIKHINYSRLELQLYNGDYSDNTIEKDTTQKQKRGLYYKLPRYLRARLYYWYRYYIQLGFLDGEAGKIFIYLQAYWYRFIVDAKIYEQLEGKEKK
ncbi:MAG: glycosyltransferase family 2 protein [Ruminococcus sp.]|nr:glycosyltransferase family 2 protein [Ruminococcus sp.]